MNNNYPPPPDYDRSPAPQPEQPSQRTLTIPAYRPYVAIGVIIVTVIVFILQEVSSYALGVDIPASLGAKINTLIVQGQLWRLITPVFLHGSITHIGFNMYALYAFGPGLERTYGHGRFAMLYFLSGFAGNVASFLLSPEASLGASTAIFGLIGAEAVFLYQNKSILRGGGRQALTQVILVAVINLAFGAMPGVGIDNWGHVGGLIAGTAFAWTAGPLLTVEGIAPSFYLKDQRELRDALVATAAIGALFTIAAVVVIYMRLK